MFSNEQAYAVLDAPNEVASELVERAEILARTRVTRPTLSRWITAGVFPPPLRRWPGKGPRWRREAVEKFFRELQ